MKTEHQKILVELFNPISQDCQTVEQDLQLSITLNPDIKLITKAMELAEQSMQAEIESLKDWKLSQRGCVQCVLKNQEIESLRKELHSWEEMAEFNGCRLKSDTCGQDIQLLRNELKVLKTKY